MFEMPHLDNIFINYVLASRSGFTRATTEVIHFEIKGVIEILSSIIELGGLKSSEDKINNSTYTGCLYHALTGRIDSIRVGSGR